MPCVVKVEDYVPNPVETHHTDHITKGNLLGSTPTSIVRVDPIKTFNHIPKGNLLGSTPTSIVRVDPIKTFNHIPKGNLLGSTPTSIVRVDPIKTFNHTTKGNLLGSTPTSIVRVDPIKTFKKVTFDTSGVHTQIDTPRMQYPAPVDHPNMPPEPDPDPDPDLHSDSYLTIPDLSNVLITYKVLVNGIDAIALIDSGAQEDFVDTNYVVAYNMPTSSTSRKRFVSLANGSRQDASATLTNATMVMTPIPGKGYHLFEDHINPTVTSLGRYNLILGKPWLTKVNPTPDWTLNTLKIQLPNGKQGVFQGIITTPTQEAHIAHLDVDTFKQAVDEGVDHFYGFLRPDHSQNMALFGLTTQSIQLSDPLPSQTLPS
jgi:hypothetical protein